jgi:hypothetical protein
MNVRRRFRAAVLIAIVAASVFALNQAPANAAPGPSGPSPVSVTLTTTAATTAATTVNGPGIQCQICCVLRPVWPARVGTDAVISARVECNALVASITVAIWLYREGAAVSADSAQEYVATSANVITGKECVNGVYYAYYSASVYHPYAVPRTVFTDTWSPLVEITGCG